MGEKYIFLGWAKGSFETQDTHEKRQYYQLFVMQQLVSRSGDSEVSGFRAEKLRCSGEVWQGLELCPFDKVALVFDRFQRVIEVQVVERHEDKPSK